MKEPFFKIGDKVTYKNISQCIDSFNQSGYWYSGDDQEGYVGEVQRINEFVSEKNCYQIYVTSRLSFPYSMLECEFLEYDETSEQSKFPKEVAPKLQEKRYSDISNTLTKFDHFFKVKSPLTDLFQQFIEEICGVDTFLEGVDIDYIIRNYDDIKNITEVFTNMPACVFTNILFYKEFDINDEESNWYDLLDEYNIDDDFKIKHNRYSELISSDSKVITVDRFTKTVPIQEQTNKKLFKF